MKPLALVAVFACLILAAHECHAGFKRGSGFNQGDLELEDYSVIFAERSSDPATPSTDEIRLYAKDNGGTTTLYTKDSAGSVSAFSGGGAPTTADYLVGTNNGSLSAEIVVGTSPGGELGGTWGSPTLDDSITVDGWTLTNVANFTATTATISSNTVSSSMVIPNGSAPGVDVAGEIAIDTTADQLKYYGAETRVISRFKTECVVVEDPVDADDNIPLWIWPEASTITDVSCNTTGSSTPNIAIVLGDGTNSLESITCDDDGATDDGSITNATFNAEEPVEADFAAPSGTVDWCTVCVTRTVNAS